MLMEKKHWNTKDGVKSFNDSRTHKVWKIDSHEVKVSGSFAQCVRVKKQLEEKGEQDWEIVPIRV